MLSSFTPPQFPSNFNPQMWRLWVQLLLHQLHATPTICFSSRFLTFWKSFPPSPQPLTRSLAQSKVWTKAKVLVCYWDTGKSICVLTFLLGISKAVWLIKLENEASGKGKTNSPVDSLYGVACAHADYSSVTSATALPPPPGKTAPECFTTPSSSAQLPRQKVRAWF